MFNILSLRRSGRFDFHIHVPMPDANGRYDILKIHMNNIELDCRKDCENSVCDFDMKYFSESFEKLATELAYLTDNFSGADLANLVNEVYCNCIGRANI